MSNIAKFTAVRGNGLEFLAKYEDGNTEWIDVETIYRLYVNKQLPFSAVGCANGSMQINIFGRLYKADQAEYEQACKKVKPIEEKQEVHVEETKTPAKEQSKSSDGKKGIKLKNPAILDALRKEKEAEDKKKQQLKEQVEAVKVTKKTLSKYYRADGNLYYYDKELKTFEIVDGFSEEECANALSNKVPIVFISGAPLDSKQSTKIAKPLFSKKSVAQEVRDIEKLERYNEPIHYGSYYEGIGGSSYDFDAKDYVSKH